MGNHLRGVEWGLFQVVYGSIGKTDVCLLSHTVSRLWSYLSRTLWKAMYTHCTLWLEYSEKHRRTCPKLPRCFLLLPKGQSQDVLTPLLPGPSSPKQPFPHLTGVAKVAATLPWSPVFFRTYGDPSKDDPPGGEFHPVHKGHCVAQVLCFPATLHAPSPHGRKQRLFAQALTVSAWRVTKCVH